jgi:hypothetical protein
MPKLPIKAVESEIITLLEFVRVAVTEFPKTTDKILDCMDLNDEAFMEEVNTLCRQVNFDFDEKADDLYTNE